MNGTTWTTRLPARLKDLAGSAGWVRTTVPRYGRTETADLAVVEAIWYRPFGIIVQSMVIVWCTLHGYDPADVLDLLRDYALAWAAAAA